MIFRQFSSIAGCMRSFMLVQNVDLEFPNFDRTTDKVRLKF